MEEKEANKKLKDFKKWTDEGKVKELIRDLRRIDLSDNIFEADYTFNPNIFG